MEKINEKELGRVKGLYKNEIELKKILDSQDNTVMIEEYYLISMDWIESFKKIFHYDDIIAPLISKMKGEIKIENLQNIDIPKEDKKKLRIIQNSKILQKFDIEGSVLFFYESF